MTPETLMNAVGWRSTLRLVCWRSQLDASIERAGIKPSPTVRLGMARLDLIVRHLSPEPGQFSTQSAHAPQHSS